MRRLTVITLLLLSTMVAEASEGDFSVSDFNGKRMFTYTHGFDAKARSSIIDAQNRGKRIDALAFTGGGNWVLVAEDEVRYSDRTALMKLKKDGRAFPEILEEMIRDTRTIDEIVFTSRGNWIIQNGSRIVYSNEAAFDNIGLRQQLTTLAAGDDFIQSISVGANGKWMVIAGGKGYAGNVSDVVLKLFRNAEGIEKRTLTGAWFRPGRTEWIITSTTAYWASKPIENRAHRGYGRFHRVNAAVNLVALMPTNGLALISNWPLPEGNLADQLERNLLTGSGRTTNLWDAMEAERVHGIAFAIIDNNQIEAIRGYGRRKGGKGFIDYETYFSAASMSKAVAAFGIAKAVELGELDWTTTLSQYIDRHPDTILSEWREAVGEWARDEELVTANGENQALDRLERIRLQDLLTHTAGLNRWGIGLYGPSRNMNHRDILFAKRNYRNDGLLVPFKEPQSQWLYSGGGFTLAEMILEFETGRPFREFMDTEVLEPLGMQNSTFGSLTDAQKKQLAYGHNRDGRDNLGYRESPGKAAGGLYTTAEDYARFVLALMNDGRDVETGRQVLSTARHWDLIQPARSVGRPCNQSQDCSTPIERCMATFCSSVVRIPRNDRLSDDRVGMGLELSRDSNSRGRPARFWHGGTQAGYRAFFVAEPETGKGIVMLTNSTSSWLKIVPKTCLPQNDWIARFNWNAASLEEREGIAESEDPPCGQRFDKRGAPTVTSVTLVPGVQEIRESDTCLPSEEWHENVEWIRLSLEFREKMAASGEPPCGYRYDRRGASTLIRMLRRGYFALP